MWSINKSKSIKNKRIRLFKYLNFSNSNPLKVLVYLGLWSYSYPLSKSDTKYPIKPPISVFSYFRIENRRVFNLQIKSFLVFILVSFLQHMRILVKYFFTIVLAFLMNLCRLKFAWFHTLIILIIQIEIDFHSLLPLWWINRADLWTKKNLFFYHFA